MTRRAGIIVAMTEDGVIGLDGSVPWHYSADLKRFKRTTLHSTIIMGRKTWESLPFKPLPQRQNIVITRNSALDVQNFSSIGDALAHAENDTVWFIGGARIYEEAVMYSELIDVTHVPDRVSHPRCVKFPDVDWSDWNPGPRILFEDDSRLYYQRFTRKN